MVSQEERYCAGALSAQWLLSVALLACLLLWLRKKVRGTRVVRTSVSMCVYDILLFQSVHLLYGSVPIIDA